MLLAPPDDGSASTLGSPAQQQAKYTLTTERLFASEPSTQTSSTTSHYYFFIDSTAQPGPRVTIMRPDAANQTLIDLIQSWIDEDANLDDSAFDSERAEFLANRLSIRSRDRP